MALAPADSLAALAAQSPIDSERRRLLQGLLAAGTTAGIGCSRAPGSPPTIEDVSRLDETPVAEVMRPRSTQAIAERLARSDGAVSIGGARYSMGGQIVAPGSLHIDMRGLDRLIWLDAARKRVRVQAGMTWRDLQDHIDPHDLSVKVMQSYSNFSVGGSVSVNCHGRYVGRGSVAGTVRALQLVSADGRVLELSHTLQPELFGAVIGGYGGLGVVTEVELDLDENTPLQRRVQRITLDTYPDFFNRHVRGDPEVVLHNADLAPPDFDAPLAVSWRRSDARLTQTARLVPRGLDYAREQNLIWSASELPGGDRLRDRFMTERLLHEQPVVWRNHEASLDTASLEPRTRRLSTYLLQEYFIPVPAFVPFARTLAGILKKHQVNALNVSIRHAPGDDVSLLAWAPREVFSFVLYYKQRSTQRADRRSQAWTRELIDAALAHGGRYYLPYRLHASRAQFDRAYPEARDFARIKRELDPRWRFRNRLWDRYLPA